ncbi:integrase core domain-containing protein [Brevundimonas sp.]|uniref:integrase core domain-containing protein n=1 Tax=Brevundimonas sp. TaxID=1871086 RepID=UPI003917DBDF
MRDELLNEILIFDLGYARLKLAARTDGYNYSRPQSSIGYLTLAAYDAILSAAGRCAEQLESCAAPPVAQIALRSVAYVRTHVAAGWRHKGRSRGADLC